MNKISLITFALVALLLGSCQSQSHYQMRGVVLNTVDLSTVDWAKKAHEAGINTIGTHMYPGEVVEFLQTQKGKRFMADCRRYGIEVEHQLHSMAELLPRELFAEDSTMFRMDEKGKRVGDWNCCVASEKALEIIAQNAIKYAKLGIRNITSFAVYMDSDYFEAYPEAEYLKEYAHGLKEYKTQK